MVVYTVPLRLMLMSFVQHIERPKTLIEEDPRAERLGPVARVDKMFEQIQDKVQEPPKFILCVIPKKGSDIYGMTSVIYVFKILHRPSDYPLL